MELLFTFKGYPGLPLLMHAPTTVDPAHPVTLELKKITGKRKKVEADHAEMARIEFYAGLYYDPEMGPYIPATVIEACLVEGAKKSKLGKAFKSTVFCTENARLEYDGPRDVDELYADQRFHHRCRVRVGQASVMRLRPQFINWTLQAKITLIEAAEVDKAAVEMAAEIAGERIGICDWRPKFGRFEATLN